MKKPTNPAADAAIDQAARRLNVTAAASPDVAAFLEGCASVTFPPTEAQEEELAALYAGAVDALRADPELVRLFGVGGLLQVVAENGRARMAGPPALFEPLRMRELPSVAGRVVWTLLDGADIDAMRRELRPGSVWVCMDTIDSAAWAVVNSTAQMQRRYLGLAVDGKPGRPEGWRDPALANVRAAIAANPRIPLADVHGLLAADGLANGPYKVPRDPRASRANAARARWIRGPVGRNP